MAWVDATKLWISLKLLGMRAKFLLFRAVAMGGIALMLLGGYAILQPGMTVAPGSRIIGSLPILSAFTPTDGIILIVVGAVITGLSTRT